jgi:hypothetical protein
MAFLFSDAEASMLHIHSMYRSIPAVYQADYVYKAAVTRFTGSCIHMALTNRNSDNIQ